MQLTYSIYKIVSNVNQKVYIGFTSKCPVERFRAHIKDSKNENDLRKFYCALRKHGCNNFELKIIYQSQNKQHTFEVMEDFFICAYNSIEEGYNTKPGGTGEPSKRRTRTVYAYDNECNLIKVFNSCVEAAQYLGVASGTISTACINADKNKSSQIKQHWLCYEGCKPTYRTWDNTVAVNRARQVNTGKKRPQHSACIKANARRDPKGIYIIPEGEFILTDAVQFYGQDLLYEWCKKNPDKIITKMMISKSKKLSLETHLSWIGKTRREVGFGYKSIKY